MSDLLVLALSLVMTLVAGALLGALFFGGLWWTVVMGLASSRPALWFLGSMVLRMAILLAGLAMVGGDDWRRWIACLVGIVVARMVVKRMTRTPAQPLHQPLDAPTQAQDTEAQYAP